MPAMWERGLWEEEVEGEERWVRVGWMQVLSWRGSRQAPPWMYTTHTVDSGSDSSSGRGNHTSSVSSFDEEGPLYGTEAWWLGKPGNAFCSDMVPSPWSELVVGTVKSVTPISGSQGP